MGYSPDMLRREIAFLAYYLHWDHATLMALDHGERRRWCAETSALNRQASEPAQPAGRSLEDF